jgi:hypothetical protein
MKETALKRLPLLALIVCLLAVACSSGSSGDQRPTTTQVAAASPTILASAPAATPAPASPSAVIVATEPVAPTPIEAVTTEPTAASARLPELPEGWTRIDGGGEAICARGTPYSFWVRPGRVNKLLIFFQGGGGCWDAESCREGSSFFQDSVDESDNPDGGAGIFDLDHPENPFKDYYMVYVPYCTGDVHMGNNVHTYRENGQEVTIHFKGFVNGSTVMQWVYDHVGAPESIFVSGCSAGSVGSITFAPQLINHYRSARVYQLGDSEAFVFGRPIQIQNDWRAHDNFPVWIPALQEIKPGEWTAERFYTAIANHYPQHIFSQYNTAHDAVQQRYFFAAGGAGGSWEAALESSLSHIQAHAPNFRSYLASGSSHCIMPFASFYTRETNGVRFRDWVAAIAEGRDVENVRCTQCEQSE